jgi:hypothetical protein
MVFSSSLTLTQGQRWRLPLQRLSCALLWFALLQMHRQRLPFLTSLFRSHIVLQTLSLAHTSLPEAPKCTRSASRASSAADRFATPRGLPAHITRSRATSIAGTTTCGCTCRSARYTLKPCSPCDCAPLSPLLFQVCCVSVTSKYSCNDWGQVMCMSHSPEASQCFDCGRYITSVAELPKRQRLLQYLSSSSREALFSDVAHSSSPSPPAALTAAKSHVTCIVDGGRLVDGRTQVKL